MAELLGRTAREREQSNIRVLVLCAGGIRNLAGIQAGLSG